MKHTHQFIEPYAPWPLEAHVAHIDAEQTHLSFLRELARNILANARSALPMEVSDKELPEWIKAAQWYLDCNGQDEDLPAVWDGLDAWLNPVGYGAGEGDAGWRLSHAAETHFGGRHFG